MSSDPEAEIRASVGAHADLGPGYEDAVAEGLVERIGAEIDRRIDARLAQTPGHQGPAAPAGAQPGVPAPAGVASAAGPAGADGPAGYPAYPAPGARVPGLRVDGLWAREGGRVDRLHQWQPTDLRRAIQADHPVIVQVGYRALPMHSASTTLDDHYIVVHGTVDGDFVYSDPIAVGGGGQGMQISEHDLIAAMGQASTPRAGFALAKSKN